MPLRSQGVFKRPPVLAEFALRALSANGDAQAADTPPGCGVRMALCSVHLRANDTEARREVEDFGSLVLPALQAPFPRERHPVCSAPQRTPI